MRAFFPAASVHAARRNRRLAALVMAVAAGWMPAWSGIAVGAVPRESTAQRVPDPAHSAIVGDVDGDGIRELVTIGPRQANPAHLAVEVVAVDEAGGVRTYEQSVLRRGVAPDTVEQPGARPVGALIPLSTGEPARLLAWQEDGVERVLAVAVGTAREPRACCLTIWRVTIDEEQAATDLQLMSDTQLAADAVVALDLNGDGTDELIVAEPPSADDPGLLLFNVLSLVGDRLMSVPMSVAGESRSPLYLLDDSDGRPGAELAFSSTVELDGEHTILHRLSMSDDGALRTDSYETPVPVVPLSMDGPDGPLIALVGTNAGIQLVSWPAETTTPMIERESARSGVALGTLGTGAGSRLYLVWADISVGLLDADLVPRSWVAHSRAADAFKDREPAPYVGRFPGGLPDGRDALIFRGQLLPALQTPVASPYVTESRPIAVLPGFTPVGALGRDRSWIALAAAAGFDPARHGGELAGSQQPASQLWVARSEIVLSSEADGGHLAPEFAGAVRDAREPSRAVLLAAGKFSARLAGPAGANVRVHAAAGAPLEAEIGSSGEIRVPIQARNGEARFRVRIEVVTLAGHAYATAYQARIVTEPPALETHVPLAPLGPTATITGRTSPGATVEVDGMPAIVAADGRFTMSVGAGLLPRSVDVVATDEVGNVARMTVSVVTPFDYRRLPWIPIVGTLTLLLTAFLYLRAPRAARDPPRAGEGTFEEID